MLGAIDMKLHRHPPPHKQQGVVLVVALIMLILITMISISAVRSTTLDEKMAGASRDRNKAFQAAEYALRTCLAPLQNNTYTALYVAPLDPAPYTEKQVWEVASNWTGTTSKEIDVTAGGMSATELAANPRCLFEKLGTSGSYRS